MDYKTSNSTEKLYHLQMNGKNILFSTKPEHTHYLKINFHFPYSGLDADFFDEKADFLDDYHKTKMELLAANVIDTMNIIVDKVMEMPMNERQALLETDTVKNRFTFILENEFPQYSEPNWGKMLRDSAVKKITDYLYSGDVSQLKQSEFEYCNSYKELVYRYGECKSLNYYLPRQSENYWLRKFENDDEYRFTSFKKLNCGYPKNSIPDSKTVTVNFEKFIEPEPEQLPLFIGTQFGLVPKTTPELWNALEGQTVAVLAKSALSGYERILKICEVKDGKFVNVREFINNAEKHLLNDTDTILHNDAENILPGDIIYCYFGKGRSYFATKEDSNSGGSFILTMLKPYRSVMWDYDCFQDLHEQDKQDLMPKLLTLMDQLYTMVDANIENWKKDLQKFKFYNKHNGEDFSFDFFLEYRYECIVNNPTIFPPELCGRYAKVCFKAILREILETGKFNYISTVENHPFLYFLEAGNKTIINVTPYDETEREDKFEYLTEKQKINLYAAMKNGYGSQFDRLVTKWMNSRQ